MLEKEKLSAYFSRFDTQINERYDSYLGRVN